jgi:hypothetical protein
VVVGVEIKETSQESACHTFYSRHQLHQRSERHPPILCLILGKTACGEEGGSAPVPQGCRGTRHRFAACGLDRLLLLRRGLAKRSWLKISETLLSRPSNQHRTGWVFSAGSAQRGINRFRKGPKLLDAGGMSRSRRRPPRRSRFGISPDDLLDYAAPPERRAGRPPKHDLSDWKVTDDWPERIPVTDAEVDVFEAWFGDLFDELFGPCR